MPMKPALAAALAFASMPAQAQVAPISCAMSAGETRWLAESYRATHTYGLGDGEWIDSYGGLGRDGRASPRQVRGRRAITEFETGGCR